MSKVITEKDQEKICVLMDHGFFEVKDGIIEIFVENGYIRSIDCRENKYRRRRTDRLPDAELDLNA